MEHLITRCAGLDVHQATVVATVRVPDDHSGRQSMTETFGTMTPDLIALREWLHRHGVPVRDLRVRDLGDLARVEVDAQHVERLQRADAALAAVRAAGFAEVEVDERGFRSGSMNELLADPGRYR